MQPAAPAPQTESPAPQTTKPTETPRAEIKPADPKWLERLSKDDRAALDETLGYAPPAFTTDIIWFNTQPTDWAKLRGKVVVIQSWTTANTAGRGWPMRISNALKEFKPEDVQILALHTPEGADAAENFMNRQKPPEGTLVAIDPVGTFCDALGVFKHPVNLLIDRNGLVRYAGLNLNGVKEAVAELVAEPFDASIVPPQKSAAKPEESSGPTYPPTSNKISGAMDKRGKKAPDFAVERWYTQEVSLNGRPVVLTFWNKDDAKRLPAHDYLNTLAKEFGRVAAIVMICEENKSGFEESILRRNEKKSDFDYGVALDRERMMAGALNITGTPYTIVMSRDWIVRWQGRTNDLTRPIVQQIIDADAAAAGTLQNNPGSAKRRGWVQ